jgi:peptidoglycan/xylan/chitin deacetylase (PgdA/CDA1 family)
MGMEVGLHGRNHVDWRREDERGLHSEIDMAREELSAILGADVRAASIPFGAYNRRVVQYLKQRSFNRIYTSDGISMLGNRVVTPRFTVRSDHSLSYIERLLDNRPSLIEAVYNEGRRVMKEYVL